MLSVYSVILNGTALLHEYELSIQKYVLCMDSNLRSGVPMFVTREFMINV